MASIFSSDVPKTVGCGVDHLDLRLGGLIMRGKKEQVKRGSRPGLGADEDLMLLKLVLDEHPRLKERVVRYIEAYLKKSPEDRRRLAQKVNN